MDLAHCELFRAKVGKGGKIEVIKLISYRKHPPLYMQKIEEEETTEISSILIPHSMFNHFKMLFITQ